MARVCAASSVCHRCKARHRRVRDPASCQHETVRVHQPQLDGGPADIDSYRDGVELGHGRGVRLDGEFAGQLAVPHGLGRAAQRLREQHRKPLEGQYQAKRAPWSRGQRKALGPVGAGRVDNHHPAAATLHGGTAPAAPPRSASRPRR